MNIMTVVANPNPKSFCHAILERFDAGLKDAGHTNDIVDLYAMRRAWLERAYRLGKDFAV